MSAGTFIATAYGPPWDTMNGGGTTATGIKLPAAAGGSIGPPYIVAVDPKVIPLGTRLKISPNPTGDPNTVWQAEDTGGAITGNRIDFLDLAGRTSQDNWGRQPVTVSVVTSSGTSPPASSPTVATTPAVSGGSATSSPSSSGPSGFVKLLIDVALITFGAAAIYRGTRHGLAARSGS